jgi:hypothetical protein
VFRLIPHRAAASSREAPVSKRDSSSRARGCHPAPCGDEGLSFEACLRARDEKPLHRRLPQVLSHHSIEPLIIGCSGGYSWPHQSSVQQNALKMAVGPLDMPTDACMKR